MFTGCSMFLPGQEVTAFNVIRPNIWENAKGQTLIGEYEALGVIKGVAAASRPEENERWRQLNHSVSHKIIMRGKPDFDIKPGDAFEDEQRGIRYYVQTVPYDVGGLGRFVIFYCMERTDVKRGQ